MPELLGRREIALLQPRQKQVNISHIACIREGLLSFIDVPGYLKDSNSAAHYVDSTWHILRSDPSISAFQDLHYNLYSVLEVVSHREESVLVCITVNKLP